MVKKILITIFCFFCVLGYVNAQGAEPLRIDISEGVIEPMPVAVTPFLAKKPEAAQLAKSVTALIKADLVGSGLFKIIPQEAYISNVTDFDAPIEYQDWQVINAQVLLTGEVNTLPLGKVSVKFRLFDVFGNAMLGDGLQFSAKFSNWRRIAHRVADTAYNRISGEEGYFESRLVFVQETGPKNERKKRLAMMDYDGANISYLTDGLDLVMNPRVSLENERVFYTSYQSGLPKIHLLDIKTGTEHVLMKSVEQMAFAPRPSPDGESIVFSMENRGNVDIYTLPLSGTTIQRLTSSPAIDTAPGFSPDGREIVFESDRSGQSQIYIMPAEGGAARRISFGEGRYGAPVWSPRGDMIAFTKQHNGRFHIGVMRTDGSEERLLTSSFMDEGATWAPNGRVIMFTRETRGPQGLSELYTIDISGRNLRKVPMPTGASDPAWSGL